LYGDGFDQFGLPEVGFVSEFGHWQSNRVVGHKTGLSDEQRIGGLSSLGLDLIPSFDPRTKVIETAFNQLQYQLDAQPGFAGRDQRKHLPETVKRLRAECESGKRHPKDVFPHVSQLADSVQTAMENINQERGDGMILRGDTPLEKWTADGAGARLRRIPDEARWLYRSAMNVVPVTKNGLRITQGTGHKMVTHYYDGPALHPLPRGEKLSVYWNDHNPEADAILLRHGRYFGTATYVPHLSRFNATDEQLSAEAARKKAALHYARTELRAIQPEMKRCAPVIPVSTSSVEIGRKIADAEDAVTRTAREKANLQRQTAARLAKTPLDWDELGEPSEISNLRSQISEPVAVAARGITEAELNEL
jgi:hypothetical protein